MSLFRIAHSGYILMVASDFYAIGKTPVPNTATSYVQQSSGWMHPGIYNLSLAVASYGLHVFSGGLL